jgi:MarR family transcriptional regulator, organic hydroperoxide resistance regulator
MSRAKLTAESVGAQREVIRALLDAALGDLLELDLSMAQLKALAALQRQPNCSIGMLSEQLGIKPPASSLLVDKLVRSGLAFRERDPLDGRRVIVQPTVQGANLISRIRHGARSLLERWVGQLADDDLAALRQGSRALAEVAGGLPQPRLGEVDPSPSLDREPVTTP